MKPPIQCLPSSLPSSSYLQVIQKIKELIPDMEINEFYQCEWCWLHAAMFWRLHMTP